MYMGTPTKVGVLCISSVSGWPFDMDRDSERRLLRRGTRIEDFPSPILHEIHQYWLGKRGGRVLPPWSDIDPIEIPRLLPNLIVVGVEHGPLRFLFRLVGSLVIEFRGNVTGPHVDDVPWNTPETRASVQESYALAVEQRTPVFVELEIRTRSGAHRHIYGGVWPVAAGPDVPVDRCLAAEDYGDLSRADLR
jgi:hypothetical protein